MERGEANEVILVTAVVML